MEGKKKLIIALTSICGVLFATIIAMGIVWAATSQTITSVIRVTYTAVDVSGSMSANVYFGSNTATAMNGGTNGTITFDANTTSTTGTLTPAADTTLTNTAGQTFVIYEYIISNSSTLNAMNAVLTYADDSTSPNAADANIKVYAYTSSSAVTNPHTNVATLYGAADETVGREGMTVNQLSSTTGQFISTTIAAEGTTYCYVVVALSNANLNAEFSGTFSWVLTKSST